MLCVVYRVQVVWFVWPQSSCLPPTEAKRRSTREWKQAKRRSLSTAFSNDSFGGNKKSKPSPAIGESASEEGESLPTERHGGAYNGKQEVDAMRI